MTCPVCDNVLNPTPTPVKTCARTVPVGSRRDSVPPPPSKYPYLCFTAEMEMTCPVCDKVVKDATGLKRHMESHSEVGRFQCHVSFQPQRFSWSVHNQRIETEKAVRFQAALIQAAERPL